MATPQRQTANDPWNRELEQVVKSALGSIRFGTVTLVVQDGRVVQVEKQEKIRLPRVGFLEGAGI